MALKPLLGYWNFRGLGGCNRALLAHLNVDYENKMYDIGEDPDVPAWFGEKPNLGIVFPNLPYWRDEDVFISESTAVLRAISTKYNPDYLGRTLKEKANADMISSIGAAANTTIVMGYWGPDWREKQEGI
jgi:glutathione S-transferase